MRALPRTWTILLYHDVSWEESGYVRSFGGTCPPDLFRAHVETVASLGDLVGIAEGERRLRDGGSDAPCFSFWFDDGRTGVARHAAPVLEERGLAGAVSVCSRFVEREAFFWRYKLSYLNAAGGIERLRARLARLGLGEGESVKRFTEDRFSPDVLRAVEEEYERATTPAQRADAFRLFLDGDGVRRLHRAGWTVANHTAAHYPVAQAHSLSLLREQFEECEAAIEALCEHPSDHWVLPFDRKRSPDLLRAVEDARGDRALVLVGDRANTPARCADRRVLYRVTVPVVPPRALARLLRRVER
jgi:peptidoglycan/xylan/chitin deacetylase (PgdA/CDA1 family)